jgi:hypothetical protein
MDLSWLLGRIFIILGRDRVIIIIGDGKNNFNIFFIVAGALKYVLQWNSNKVTRIMNKSMECQLGASI